MDSYKVIELVNDVAKAKFVSKEVFERIKQSLNGVSLELKIVAESEMPYSDSKISVTKIEVAIFDNNHITLVIDSNSRVVGLYLNLPLKDYTWGLGLSDYTLVGYQSLDGRYIVSLNVEKSWSVGSTEYDIKINFMKNGELLPTNQVKDKIVNKRFAL